MWYIPAGLGASLPRMPCCLSPLPPLIWRTPRFRQKGLYITCSSEFGCQSLYSLWARGCRFLLFLSSSLFIRTALRGWLGTVHAWLGTTADIVLWWMRFWWWWRRTATVMVMMFVVPSVSVWLIWLFWRLATGAVVAVLMLWWSSWRCGGGTTVVVMMSTFRLLGLFIWSKSKHSVTKWPHRESNIHTSEAIVWIALNEEKVGYILYTCYRHGLRACTIVMMFQIVCLTRYISLYVDLDKVCRIKQRRLSRKIDWV